MNALLALALLLQDSPEEIFRKIESAIENAKTVRVRFALDLNSKETQASEGLFTIEEAGKVNLSVNLRNAAGTSSALSITSDGTTTRSQAFGQQAEAPCDRAAQRKNLNMYLSRMGIFVGAMFDHGMRAGASRSSTAFTLDMKQLFQVQNLRDSGEGKNGSKTLTYEFKSAIDPMPVRQMKIWYDPKTYRLLGRECTFKLQDIEGIVIERYPEFEFDGVKAPAAGPAAADPAPAADPPIADEELAGLFIQAKLQVAEQNLKSGKKEKAIEILQEVLKTYPQHPKTADVRRLLEEARKK